MITPTTVATLWLGHYEHPWQPHFQSLMPNSNNFPILDFNIIPPVHVQRPMKKAVLKDKYCTSESLARKKKNGARKRSVCAKIVEIEIEAVNESLAEKKIKSATKKNNLMPKLLKLKLYLNRLREKRKNLSQEKKNLVPKLLLMKLHLNLLLGKKKMPQENEKLAQMFLTKVIVPIF